jgi:hypothetical protein
MLNQFDEEPANDIYWTGEKKKETQLSNQHNSGLLDFQSPRPSIPIFENN